MSQLNLFEKSLKVLGGLITVPIAPLFLESIHAKNVTLIYRFGKFDRSVEPGLRWIPPFYEYYNVFIESVCTHHKDLNLLDKHGNPIIINSNVNYKITGPRTYVEMTDFNKRQDIVSSNIAVAIRNALQKYPLISESEDDILNGGQKFSDNLKLSVQQSVLNFGIGIESVTVTEAKYAPEIASQMLAKQQARAYVEARNLIVQGAMETVKDVSEQLKNLSPEAKEKLAVNLLTVLAGNSHAQPTIKM